MSTQSENRKQANALVRTATKGIYKRGNSFVVVYREPGGRQRKRSAPTLTAARELKASLHTDIQRGEYRASSRLSFAEYLPQWKAGYAGRTSRGIRAQTLTEYGKALEEALPYFGRMRLSAIEPRHLKEYAASLAQTSERRKRGLSPNSVRLKLAPVRLLLATAFEEGLIRSNPAAGVRLSQQKGNALDSQEQAHAKALTEEQLELLLAEIPSDHRLFFELLAQTGLRISEALALRWEDLDFGTKRLKVQRRLYKGTLAAPKSRYGRREVPLSTALAQKLWTAKGSAGEETLIFAAGNGSALDSSNLFSRILKPAARRVGLDWVGFHSFRHSCATILFRRGWNAVQVQRFLGHHSPAFTLATYVHLLPDDLPSPEFWGSFATKSDHYISLAAELAPAPRYEATSSA